MDQKHKLAKTNKQLRDPLLFAVDDVVLSVRTFFCRALKISDI